jgi:transcriptional regulator with XRE-family HTH domain
MPRSQKNKPKDAKLLAFGCAVRASRKAMGYSQETFADVCGIDRSYMGGIERGEHNVALLTIFKITAALGLEPYDFFQRLEITTVDCIRLPASTAKDEAMDEAMEEMIEADRFFAEVPPEKIKRSSASPEEMVE